jgi:hypothetical protein
MPYMKTTFALIVALILIALPSQAAEPPRSKIKRFVEEVTLGSEYGDNPKKTRRWMTAPMLSVFGGTPEQKSIVEEVIMTINPSLRAQNMEIQLMPDNSEAATLKVYFAKIIEFQKLAKKNNFKYVQGNLSFFCSFWDEKNNITSSFALIASDKLKGSKLKHHTFEAITRSLGLINISNEFTDSIFYKVSNNDEGNTTCPSALDLQLLQWFYENVLPAENRMALSAKFDETWPK